MQEWFDLFIKEKTYLKGVTPRTIGHYKDCWAALERYSGSLSETGLKDWVMNMRQAEVSTGSCNSFIRGMNSFLTWLFENKYTETHLKIKLLRQEKRVLSTYSEREVREILHYKGKHRWEKRIHVLLLFMVDTGCRIDECLTLQRDKVDFDNLLVTVAGKGRKERIVPISREVRAELYQYLKTHNFELVFCSRDGLQLRYDNMRRDFLKVLDALKIEKKEGAFHAFRRFFGKRYVRQGGNLFYLMKHFGHTSLEMSKRYVEASTEELQEAHMRIGMVSKLK